MGAKVVQPLVARPWRVGRRNGRVVYAVVTDAASDDDPMIGAFDSPELAMVAVIAHNTLLGKRTP